MKSPEPQLRIGFILHAMQVAGAEVLVAQTIRRLRDHIVSTVFCLDSIGSIGQQLQAEGMEVICLHRKPGRDWGLGKRLASAAKEHGIEVMHAHQYTPFFYAAMARILGGARYRVIFTEHGRHYPDKVSGLRRAVNRLVLSRYADAVNACCRFSAEALARNDGFTRQPIEVIENGIEFSRFQNQTDRSAVRKQLGLDCTRRYIATVARFHPVKDHESLIRAFSQLATHYPDVDLLLAGDGSLRDQLVSLVRSLSIEARVKFLGVRSDVPEILQAVDIFALTSLCEAASLTLLEAMAAGLPVVVTDVGGNPEIVRSEIDGYLAQRQDVAGIAQALKKLLDHPDRARSMGIAGQERVRDHYSLDRTINRYHQLYRRLSG
ncbi:MAG: glycosyltransferase [Gemmatales bacterium]